MEAVTEPDGAAAARHAQLAWNRTQVDYPRGKCLHELFEDQVLRSPTAIAVLCGEQRISFLDLNRHANQLARHLRRLGVGPDVPVGFCMERSIEMIEGLLGILKAGGAYVPLDPASPPERNRVILEDAHVPVLLTQTRLADRLPPHSARCVYVDASRGTFAAEHEADLKLPGCTPERLAYVMYTSGSTGQPQGVLGLHRGAVNRLFWMWRQYPYARHETACQKTSLAFVDSLCEILGPLLQGVPLALVPGEGPADLRHLVSTLSAARVSRLVLVPSLLRALLEAYPNLPQRLPHLRHCISSGETLHAGLAQEFRRRMPQCTLLNLYGSTEVSADVTCYEIPDKCPDTTVPIGRPIANTSVFILDGDGQPVSQGACGELYVGGDGLSRGYLNRPDLTAERFVPPPFGGSAEARLFRTGDLGRFLPDGNIEFLGRADQQVKIRGCRVEPGEIESVLRQHDAVRDVAVVGHDDASGDKRLVAYVAPRMGQGLAEDALVNWLRQRVPDYMIPAAFVSLERLPLNSNGKVDRQALLRSETVPAMGGSPGDAFPPFLEKLYGLWHKSLGRGSIGLHDSFFALGGNSLSALNMILEVEATFGVTVPQDFFTSPTIENLARLLAGSSPVPTDAGPADASPTTAASTRPRDHVRPKPRMLRGVRRVSETFAFRLHFPLGIAWLRAWVGHPTVRRLFYRQEKALIQRFVADIAGADAPPLPTHSQTDGSRLSLVLDNALLTDAVYRKLNRIAKSMIGHREFGDALAALRSPFWEPFAQIAAAEENATFLLAQRYVLTGIDSLQPFRAQGRGVILLTYHTPVAHFLMPLLDHWGFPRSTVAAWNNVFRPWHVKQASGDTRSSSEEPADLGTRLALESHATLIQGGLVVIQGDGRRGHVHTHWPICGRFYPLRAGFAELAIRTRAAVIPTTATLDADGRIHIDLHAELDAGSEAQTPAERVLHLVRQYAAFLDTVWRRMPESLTLRRMKLHLELPIVGTRA